VVFGGAGKRLVTQAHKTLSRMPPFLFSLDYDGAGRNASSFWKTAYCHNIFLYPTPEGKSPGGALQKGVDLRRWVIEGIEGSRRKS